MDKESELERFHERNFENSRNVPTNFWFGQCGSSDNPSTFIKQREPES